MFVICFIFLCSINAEFWTLCAQKRSKQKNGFWKKKKSSNKYTMLKKEIAEIYVWISRGKTIKQPLHREALYPY